MDLTMKNMEHPSVTDDYKHFWEPNMNHTTEGCSNATPVCEISKNSHSYNLGALFCQK